MWHLAWNEHILKNTNYQYWKIQNIQIAPKLFKKMKSVIKNLSQKKSQVQMVSSVNSSKQLRRKQHQSCTKSSRKQEIIDDFPWGTKLPLFDSQGKGKWSRIKLYPLLWWLFYFWERGPCLALSPGRGTPKVTMWPDLPLRTGCSDPPSSYIKLNVLPAFHH